MYDDTRYLFLLIRFKLLSFSTSLPRDENGCKNTTFFHSGKIFFQ